ncbi:hypothetical protein [Cytobacillus solani]|uniref:Uncharacterized protein n=1 Tax=Cytobacillus solani TaxID=1637975 RepID=A0A0Q3SQ60_9BACI|nr:hypothetical protein [Cytobacillus solani]KQL21660.1 hypothetical protein AN957_25955 [Cytobacillus solani]
MQNQKAQKPRSITLTSGHIKELAKDCERLNIRGSVTLHQEIHLKEISTHGFSTFHSHVAADLLKSSGSCVIKGNCEVKEIINAGNLKMKNVRAAKLSSSGKLTIEQMLHSEHLDSIGLITVKEIHTKHFQLKLSGESRINRLITDTAFIEKDRKSISLKKKLICQFIKGRQLQLAYTDAEIVEGDVVDVGSQCNIQTLTYTKSCTISPNAKVQQIIRSENP